MFYRTHPRHLTPVGEHSLTKQSHKDECDIRTILSKYRETGVITHVQAARPTYTDLPSDLDYQTSLNIIMEAREAFAALPSKVRSAFGNDPQTFLAAFADPEQADKLRGFGLLNPLSPPTPPSPSGGATVPSDTTGGTRT